MVKVCILFAAGTNCDSETAEACRLAGAEPETVHINQLKSRERRLSDFQVLVIPGGFSYGDYISSGRILANELKHNLQEDVLAFHGAGKPISKSIEEAADRLAFLARHLGMDGSIRSY